MALTGATGEVLESYLYDAFGAAQIFDSSFSPLASSLQNNRFLFTGREWLAEAGLYDYRNRVYSPSLGRFLQTDPIRFAAGDINIYRYVSNNPINLIDPTGEIAFVPVLGALWGAAEFAISAYDFYDAAHTLADPCASSRDKLLSATGAALGIFTVGGGYGVTAKTVANYADNFAAKTVGNGADDVLNGLRLRNQLAGQEIAGGHAFGKHASEFGFKTQAEMAAHVERVMTNPTAM